MLYHVIIKKYKFKIYDKNDYHWGCRIKVEWIKEKNGEFEPIITQRDIEIYEDGSVVITGLWVGCHASPGNEYLLEYFAINYFLALESEQRSKDGER